MKLRGVWIIFLFFFPAVLPQAVAIILQNGTILPTPFATVAPLYNAQESGLLGIAIDPSFASNHFVYVYYTSQDNQLYTHGHIRRYIANGNIGTNPRDIFNITSDSPNTPPYHNGGYIKFGPDGNLYFTTPDTIYVLNLPATPILGLTATQFYGLILEVIIIVAAVGALYWKRRNKKKDTSSLASSDYMTKSPPVNAQFNEMPITLMKPDF